jgi:transcriptional antiterminator RfaH
MAAACVQQVVTELQQVDVAQTHPWCALQVWVGREKTTAQLLRQKGYEEFLPCYKKRQRRSDRTENIEVPLFPGYVFCRFDPEIRAPLVTTPRVIRIVSASNRPAVIPEEEIASLRTLLQSGLRPEGYPYYLSVGQKVRISDGPLRGAEGILAAINRGNRLVVSISLLQRSVSVEIDPEWAQRALPAN